MLAFLASGLILGFTAGISPGPLLTLVIKQTIEHGKIAGIKVASAPLITDGPIILITFLLFTKIADMRPILGIISLLGALYLAHIGYESFTIQEKNQQIKQLPDRSLRRGIITNALSPHPYLFYGSVGGPLMIKALDTSISSIMAFIVSFLIFLVGTKIVIALMVQRSKTFLKSNAFRHINQIVGIVMVVFAMLFLKESLQFFGII